MFKKSDKKIKENDQESNAAFEEFFNQVLKKMPARSAKIISSSLTVSKAKAERFLASNSQKFDHLFDEFLVGVDSQTRRKCHETIHFATLTAAIVGFSPIPFSDAVLLVPIQLTMMMRLYKIFGAAWSEALAKGITKELVVVGLGRSLVGNVLKFVPAVGTIAGGAINATVATTITEALGWVTVKMLNDGEDIFNNVLTFEGQFKGLVSKLQKANKKK
ncbi:MAG: YcjF family protein [Lactococcus lactis]